MNKLGQLLFYFYLILNSLNFLQANYLNVKSLNFFDQYFYFWQSLINQTLIDVHLNIYKENGISSQCKKDVVYFIESAQNRSSWALKMFDSYGKPSSGIMQSDLAFLGSYDECVQSIPHEGDFTGQYCLATFTLQNTSTYQSKKHSNKSDNLLLKKPKLGICVPSTCNVNEIKILTQKVISTLFHNTTVSFSSCHYGSNSFLEDNKSYYFMIFLALIIGLVICCTIYEYFDTRSKNNHDCWKNRYSTAIFTMSLTSNFSEPRETDQASVISKVIIAFSARINYNKIWSFTSNENAIEELQGLRVIAMFFIITTHSYSFGMQWLSFKNPEQIQPSFKKSLGILLANGTFSVDSFFFISGFLVGYLTLKKLKKGKKFNIIKFYLHRYIRITPLMMVVIAFCATCLRYIGQGPVWFESITMFDKWCEQNWWVNALYLHNFIKIENMCLSHSWYSAVDMQLYLITPAILIPLYRSPNVGKLIMIILLGGSIAITACLTIFNHYPPLPYINQVNETILNGYFKQIYIKPWSRLGPYFVGIFLGYKMKSLDKKPALKKKHVITGWLITLAIYLCIFLALLPEYLGYSNEIISGVYSSISRTLWTIGLAWITYACYTGNGGFIKAWLTLKVFKPLSKVTYAAYLIHPVVIATFYGSRQNTFQFSHYLMAYFVMGNVIITYTISFILSVFFEIPFIGLEKIFIK